MNDKNEDQPMDLRLLRVFQRQVQLQCEYVLRAAAEVNAGMARVDTATVFYGLQSLLTAAANLSKALWGQGGKRAKERAALRASLAVDDDSPLRSTDMRNNYDHFDDRLMEWWRNSTNHNTVDLSIAPRSAIVGIAPIDWFRVYDPNTTHATFWGDDFDIQALVSEVERILPRAKEEGAKPHRSPVPPTPAA